MAEPLKPTAPLKQAAPPPAQQPPATKSAAKPAAAADDKHGLMPTLSIREYKPNPDDLANVWGQRSDGKSGKSS